MMDTGAKRLELECQILCNALRQSWTASDLVGVVTAARQLAEFFPDLTVNQPSGLQHALCPVKKTIHNIESVFTTI